MDVGKGPVASSPRCFWWKCTPLHMELQTLLPVQTLHCLPGCYLLYQLPFNLISFRSFSWILQNALVFTFIRTKQHMISGQATVIFSNSFQREASWKNSLLVISAFLPLSRSLSKVISAPWKVFSVLSLWKLYLPLRIPIALHFLPPFFFCYLPFPDLESVCLVHFSFPPASDMMPHP